MTIEDAKKIVLKELGSKTEIASAIDYKGMYLFIAYRDDPLEGRFDPFFSVNPANGKFKDFSPQDYPEPLDVITALQSAIAT